jgi:hypothetical protein
MASKRRQRRNACTGKHRHPDKQRANDHAYGLRRKEGDYNLHSYKCPFCRFWHVGHS